MHPLCPISEPFRVRGVSCTAAEIVAALTPVLSESRLARIEDVLDRRTYRLVPVTEGLYDRGNVSAVMRTAEALGCQAMHVIESLETFHRARRVTQGAQNWMDITRWESTEPCIAHLRAKGYRIVATCFENAQPLDELDVSEPIALFFGNEHSGISEALEHDADVRVKIPMHGFTSSFNISVAAALSLYHLQEKRRRLHGNVSEMDEETRQLLRASFMLRNVPGAQQIILRAMGK